MPRPARLETPNTLDHVMVRGLERRVIFRDDVDRTDFVARLAALAEQGAWTVSAWALLPNHTHLLVRTGTRPLARAREGVACLALEVWGYTTTAIADQLGVRPCAVYRAAQRGRAARPPWDRLLVAGGRKKNRRKRRMASRMTMGAGDPRVSTSRPVVHVNC